tara:strand:+ start:2381 stop:2632 length:252 start_codon:yes stop_codon:yes gene_type:complete
MRDTVYIEFVMNDDMVIGEQDACCKISAELGSKGLQYGTDFWFHDIVRNVRAKEVILRFGFSDQHEAMLLKLSGITGGVASLH